MVQAHFFMGGVDMDWYPLKGDGRTLLGRPFFGDAPLDAQLAATDGALWHAENGLRHLALPYAPDAPFPLTELFCFAQIERIDGKNYAVYRVDASGWPVMPSLDAQS